MKTPVPMKAKILKFIEEHEGATFADLHTHLQNFQGIQMMCLPWNQQVAVWAGMSVEATDAVNELLKSATVLLSVVTPFEYDRAGATLDLPLAYDSEAEYKELRWLPVKLLNRRQYAKVQSDYEETIAKLEEARALYAQDDNLPKPTHAPPATVQ